MTNQLWKINELGEETLLSQHNYAYQARERGQQLADCDYAYRLVAIDEDDNVVFEYTPTSWQLAVQVA